MSRPAPQSTDYYHRHPYYEVPDNLEKNGLLSNGTEFFSLVLGSDLILSVQKAPGECIKAWAFDSDGNPLAVLGAFLGSNDLLAALPIVAEMARTLYPNHLLMDSAAKEPA